MFRKTAVYALGLQMSALALSYGASEWRNDSKNIIRKVIEEMETKLGPWETLLRQLFLRRR